MGIMLHIQTLAGGYLRLGTGLVNAKGLFWDPLAKYLYTFTLASASSLSHLYILI